VKLAFNTAVSPKKERQLLFMIRITKLVDGVCEKAPSRGNIEQAKRRGGQKISYQFGERANCPKPNGTSRKKSRQRKSSKEGEEALRQQE